MKETLNHVITCTVCLFGIWKILLSLKLSQPYTLHITKYENGSLLLQFDRAALVIKAFIEFAGFIMLFRIFCFEVRYPTVEIQF